MVESACRNPPTMTRSSMARFLAVAGLTAVLVACGGESDSNREEGPSDRDTPSLGTSQDDDEDSQKRPQEKESRDEEDDEPDDD